MPKRSFENNPWKAAGFAGAVGVDLALCILLGVFGGRWLSERTGGNNLFVALGALVGLFVGIASVILFFRYYLKDAP